jgi:hypothetical protein
LSYEVQTGKLGSLVAGSLWLEVQSDGGTRAGSVRQTFG